MYFEMLEVNGGWHVKFSMPDKIKIKNRDETEMYESMFPFFILVCKNDYICRKQNDFDYGDREKADRIAERFCQHQNRKEIRCTFDIERSKTK
jgi:hypothetical protein